MNKDENTSTNCMDLEAGGTTYDYRGVPLISEAPVRLFGYNGVLR